MLKKTNSFIFLILLIISISFVSASQSVGFITIGNGPYTDYGGYHTNIGNESLPIGGQCTSSPPAQQIRQWKVLINGVEEPAWGGQLQVGSGNTWPYTTIPAANTTVGYNYTVYVQCNSTSNNESSGWQLGTFPHWASTIISNSVPSMSAVKINNTPDNIIHAYCSASDGDYPTDFGNVSYFWSLYLNGALNQTGTSGYVAPTGYYNVANVQSQPLHNWTITCGATDGNVTTPTNLTSTLFTVPDNNAPTVTSSLQLVGTQLQGSCLGQDINNDNITYTYQWYKNNVLISSGTYSEILSYQETPDTYGFTEDANYGCLVSNYTKPNGADDVLWQVKYGGIGSMSNPPNYFYNATVPISCYDYNPTKLTLQMCSRMPPTIGGQAQSFGQCYSGSWSTITNISSNTGGISTKTASNRSNLVDGDYSTRAQYNTVDGLWYTTSTGSGDYWSAVFEEGIFWVKNRYTQNVTRQVSNYTLTNPLGGDTYVFYCKASDPVYSSNFIASGEVIVNGTLTIDLPSLNYCRTNNIPLNFSYVFNNPIDKCWYSLDQGASVTIPCTTTSYLQTTANTHNLTVYANDTSGVIAQDSTTFTTEADATAPILILTSPTAGQNITHNAITDTFSLAGTLFDACGVDKCWYVHYDSGGNPTAPVYFTCSETNAINIVSGYYGTHDLLVFANDTTGNTGTDGATFYIVQPQGGGGGGGGSAPKETQVPIPFYVREKTFDQTCGFDGDQDGLKCDLNEDWISCPDDCEFPSLDKMLCIGGGECVWREAWFLKMLFLMLMLITIYLVYTDLTAGARRRMIFR